MRDPIKTTVEVATRCIVLGIVGEQIENVLRIGYDEKKERVKNQSEI